MLKEFREFILRGNLVDLAVAVVIGTAFTAVVTSLVEDILTPLIAAIGGEPDFSALSFTINGSKFRYGDFINAMLTFLIVATVLFFFVIKPTNALLSRLRTEPPVAEETRQVSRVPQRDPGVRATLRVLHHAGGGRPLELLDRLLDLGAGGLEADVGQAPGGARGDPGRGVRAGRVCDDELERVRCLRAGRHLCRQLRERVGPGRSIGNRPS